MDGLTNIIAKIHEQNEERCASVIAAAKEKAEEIIANAHSEAKSVADAVKNETEAKVRVLNAKAVSGAELDYKRKVLSYKSKVLDDVMKSAVESIKASDDDVYFGYIEKLVLSNALTGDGIILMSKKDLERLPTDFCKKINGLLGETKKVSISDNPFDIDSGFVIEYPEIRVDCSFESIIRDKNDEIRDELTRVLFA